MLYLFFIPTHLTKCLKNREFTHKCMCTRACTHTHTFKVKYLKKIGGGCSKTFKEGKSSMIVSEKGILEPMANDVEMMWEPNCKEA